MLCRYIPSFVFLSSLEVLIHLMCLNSFYGYEQIMRPHIILMLATCINHWSPYINENHPNATNSGDQEKTALEYQLSTSFCKGRQITRVDCWDVTMDGPSYSSGTVLTCSAKDGLICKNADNFPVPCEDFKIRYFCQCDQWARNVTVQNGKITSIQTTQAIRLNRSRTTILSSYKPGVFQQRITTHTVKKILIPMQRTNNTFLSCRNSRCKNGTCVPLVSDYLCLCQPGYIGKYCEIDKDDCQSEPCVYGKCFDEIDGYNCQCSQLFHGKNCDKMKLLSIVVIIISIAVVLVTMCCCFWLLSCGQRKKEDERNEKQRHPPNKVEAWPNKS